MGLLDSIVGKSFRDEKAGRVVVFSGGRRHRGYLVKSEAEELKIRSFLKMFYFADLSILLLGLLVANSWSSFIIHLEESGRPVEHALRGGTIFLGIYSLVVGVPYFFLWRSYKKALLNFVSAQDEVLVSGKSAGPQAWFILAGLAFLVLAAFLVLFLIRAK